MSNFYDLTAAEAPAPLKLLYSRKETSHALGLSIRSVDFAIAAGHIKVRRIGKKVLVPTAELKRYASCDHAFLTQRPDEDAN